MRLTQAQLTRIKSLEDAHGRLSAKRVLADARKPSSPLHSLSIFQKWNVKALSETQLLNCCQKIIGAVMIQHSVHETVIKSPAYVHDTTMPEGGYRHVVAMKADPASARESLRYTLEVASGHLRRAYDLAAPLGLSHEIDALLAQIAGVQRLVTTKAA